MSARHIAVVGLGNVGSHLLPHLVRIPEVSRLTLIDPDAYEAANRATQHVDLADIGQPKAQAQARRLRRMKPSLPVKAIAAAVQDVPLGALRADLILACVDSRRARQHINQAAWRLGVPWIDAGVSGDDWLVRVQAFVPEDDAACLECGWDTHDYAAIEQAYPCQPRASFASGAPSFLGSLAASLQAVECAKLLGTGAGQALVGSDLVLSARHHRHFVTRVARKPACLMPDHAGWRIERLAVSPATTSIGDLASFGSILRGAGESLTFAVAGQRLVTSLACEACGRDRPVLLLERAVRVAGLRCACGQPLVAPGALGVAAAVPLPIDRCHALTLAHAGLRRRDVVTLATPAVCAHYEIGGAS